ncbi:MAG: nucleotide exchange factor GrpE [Nanoarchaeota archaeon]|nr:nucleotide exchange factor GrpE [Nanoarchaeota archaeon]
MSKKQECNECENLKKDVQVLTNQLKLLQADFDNYKKRVDKEKQQLSDSAKAELVKDLLPEIDAFEKAIPLIHDEGVKLIYKNIMKTLQKQGLKRIGTAGKKFDVNLHEAVLTVTGKGEDNVIVEEVEPGYVFNNKILRHSKVVVNKKA